MNNKNIARQELKDQEDFNLILKAYKFRGYDKGVNGIYMRLKRMNVTFNKKKIRRLMRKFGLNCPIRKPNPYKRMLKSMATDNYADNILNREFTLYGPRYALLTDITYFFYGQSKTKAYLSVIKDAYTKEILSYVLSDNLLVDFVIETVKKLIRKHKKELNTNCLIHSDQGSHYTSYKFIDILKKSKIRRSMSRRGNCWDNAPQESFFGHMKDEIDSQVKRCKDYKELKLFQQAKAVAAQKQTEFNQQKYNDELETQYVAVECPNCGSTGNKIRRTTVGYCPFCGTAIKVDENCNVTFVNRNEPAT